MTIATIAFFSMFEKKKKTTAFVTCDNSAAKKGDGNWHSIFQWFYYKEGDSINVTFFYGGGGVKKVMATNYNRLLSVFLFLPL
jgi:hypothetical protein